MVKCLVMYVDKSGCPYTRLAREVLEDYEIPVTEVMITGNKENKALVKEWTGFHSVPTLIVAEEDSLLPYEPPAFLAKGDSPRGLDRGSMLTEPQFEQLARWLVKHGFTDERIFEELEELDEENPS